MTFFKYSLSIFIAIFYLFCLVYAKMEMRRLGYVAFKSSIQYRQARDEYNSNLLKYIHLTNLSRITKKAEKNQLKRGKEGQVIHVMESQLVLPQ